MNDTMVDRFSRLKALQRPSGSSSGSSRWPLVAGPVQDALEEKPICRDADLAALRETVAQVLGASVKRNCHGEHLSLQNWHGDPDRFLPDAAALRLLAPDAAEEIADAQKWLFLDTETTGLAGGTGTYPFLVGLAWREGGGLQIEQLFMREHCEERSLLASLAERLAERPVLVTFNGKSFDWPLLETRYRLLRSIPPPLPKAHLDFLHPARSLWRLRFGSVRLSQLEYQVLGWEREADLASDLIPKIYLDFVRGGAAEPLIPIFRHNQMDLRALAALSDRILSLLGDEASCRRDGLELYGLSRICERRGENSRARKLYEESIRWMLPEEADRAARTALAQLAKRDGDFLRARELWESAKGNSRLGYLAYEQLAIYYEHVAREPRQALAIARAALALLLSSKRIGTLSASAYRRTRARFEHRLLRLEGKTARTLLDALDA
jgi:hypothetical protein